MASIFLSYARDDAAKGARIAQTLEAAGHSVWWDKHIGAGSRFSAEIEEALRAADRVVVLWSKASVRSAWVLDEAAAGRDTDRLIPVLIDKVEPPLGFRQYQAIDLSGGRRGAYAFTSLLDAVAARDEALGSGRIELPPPRAASALSFRRLPIALLALLAIAVGWWLLPRSGLHEEAPVVSVAAGNGDPRSIELARSIALDLGQYRAGPLGSLAILDTSAESGEGDYAVDVTASGEAGGLHAGIAMRSRQAKGLLWSTTIEGEGLKMVDVRQQAAAKLGDVLNCLILVRRGAYQPSHEVLGLYLAGCAADVDGEEAISIYRQITAKAPKFAAGWAGLALLESDANVFSANDDRDARRKSVIDHLAEARRLDPNVEEGFAAEAFLQLDDGAGAAKALAVLDRGIAVHPDSALLHGLKSAALQNVGRMNEGVAEAEQAAELNPVSSATRQALISALAFSGRTKEAFDLLDQADRTWPGAKTFANTRYVLNLRFGDPAAALRYLRDSGTGEAAGSASDEAWAAFLEARIDPTPAKIARALDEFRVRNLSQPVSITGYVQALATFGRIDEAYAVAAKPAAQRGLRPAASVLFRPHMKALRYDPRFIALSKRLGLLDYWRGSGHWPDFCSEPRLPYNCETGAAKLSEGESPRG